MEADISSWPSMPDSISTELGIISNDSSSSGSGSGFGSGSGSACGICSLKTSN